MRAGVIVGILAASQLAKAQEAPSSLASANLPARECMKILLDPMVPLELGLVVKRGPGEDSNSPQVKEASAKYLANLSEILGEERAKRLKQGETDTSSEALLALKQLDQAVRALLDMARNSGKVTSEDYAIPIQGAPSSMYLPSKAFLKKEADKDETLNESTAWAKALIPDTNQSLILGGYDYGIQGHTWVGRAKLMSVESSLVDLLHDESLPKDKRPRLQQRLEALQRIRALFDPASQSASS